MRKGDIVDSLLWNRKGDVQLFADNHHHLSSFSKTQKQWDLLTEVTRLQHKNMLNPSSKEAHVCMLHGLMDLFGYQSGFIGELDQDNLGMPCLRVCASSSNVIGGPEQRIHAHEMSSLFGKVFTTKQCVIEKKAPTIPLQWQISMENYVGLPICAASGDVQGMICLINKQYGLFGKGDIAAVQPFLLAACNIIQASSQIKAHLQLQCEFDKEVMGRTRDLEASNEQLRQQHVNIARASSAQLQHFACMSHEIRTPLNCIIGMSSLMRHSEDMPHIMMNESLDMIVSSGNLLLTIVNDVLDWSKLLSGNVSICVEPGNLQVTFDNVVRSMESKLQAQRLKIRSSYDIRLPPTIETDSRRLLQILYNLLGNAAKFAKPGSEIEFAVQVLSVDDASESSCHSVEDWSSFDAYERRDDQHFIRFVVKDYGKGIDKSEFGNIFKAFHQASPEIEKLYGGTGLGLAITANLVRAMGGNIWVNSKVGKWTAFSVDLPIGDQPLFDGLKVRDALTGYVICVVDNDPPTLLSLERIFGYCGLKVHAFASLKVLEDEIRFQQSSNRSLICFVNESVYCDKSFQIIKSIARDTTLVSFGPNYSVPAADHHFRSLDGVIPSAVLERVVALVNTPDLIIESSCITSSVADEKRTINIEDLRILIAEDNLINQKVLDRMLKRIGVTNVKIVENGQMAVDTSSSESFDLILMDMQMPVMDGIAACRIIVHGNDNRLLRRRNKVVFVTAHVSDAYKNKCKDAGGEGFLSKPVQLNDVRGILEKVVASLH